MNVDITYRWLTHWGYCSLALSHWYHMGSIVHDGPSGQGPPFFIVGLGHFQRLLLLVIVLLTSKRGSNENLNKVPVFLEKWGITPSNILSMQQSHICAFYSQIGWVRVLGFVILCKFVIVAIYFIKCNGVSGLTLLYLWTRDHSYPRQNSHWFDDVSLFQKCHIS